MNNAQVLYLESLKMLIELGPFRCVWGNTALSSSNAANFDLNAIMYMVVCKRNLWLRKSIFEGGIKSEINYETIDSYLNSYTHFDMWQVKIIRYISGFGSDGADYLNSNYSSYEWPQKIKKAWEKFYPTYNGVTPYGWYKLVLEKLIQNPFNGEFVNRCLS